ncbi:hypothetical protein [Thiohalorhabdus sp.]|uniref:hypothetical protein n=1 Tax=Thiohalorhabdus sp. TaxID=3094134 RepID=UPI002FC3C119
MTSTNYLTAPTIATRVPGHRAFPGLEYGPTAGDRRYVRPEGMTLWGLARGFPGENLPDDATVLDELILELERWGHPPQIFCPAVAVLLEEGGIRAASKAAEYRTVLPPWAWQRQAVRLEQYGAARMGSAYALMGA